MADRSDIDARIGFAGGTALTTIGEVIEGAEWAEKAGFDSYWLSFVLGVEPMIALALAGRCTASIELGTSVVPMTGRHPIALAQLARTTQQACDGRFTLGVGPSHQIVAEAIYGETWAGPLERTREYLSALVPLCAGDSAAVDGRQLSAHATLTAPCDPVPVVLAALGPRMLALAGSATTGTHVGQTGPRTIAAHTAPAITAAATAAGRPRPRIIALVNVCVTDDPARVRAEASQGASSYAALPSYRAMLDREGIDDPTDLVLAGSIDDITDGLATYAEAGATDLRIGVLAPDDPSAAETRHALAEWLRS